MRPPGPAGDPAQPALFDLLHDARWATENSLVTNVLPDSPRQYVATAIEHALMTLRSAGFAPANDTAPAMLRALDALTGSVLWEHSAFAAEIEETLGAGDDESTLAHIRQSVSPEERRWLAKLEDAYDLVHGSSRPFADRLAGTHRVNEGAFLALRAAPWMSATTDAISDSVRNTLASCAPDAPPPTLRWFLGGWPDVMVGDLDGAFAANAWRLLRRTTVGRDTLRAPRQALAAAIVVRLAYAGLVECVFEETDDRSVIMWAEDWWHPCMGSQTPSDPWTDDFTVWQKITEVLPHVIDAIDSACEALNLSAQTFLLDPFGTRAALSGQAIPNSDERLEDEPPLDPLHRDAFLGHVGELLVSRLPLVE